MSSCASASILRRQTASFQFSSSSTNEEPNPKSQIPTTPLKFRGIPFSWEQIPGIPKHHISPTKNEEYSSGDLLPLLPPPAGSSMSRKIHRQEEKRTRVSRDPFFAALVACSKDGDRDHDGNTVGNMWRGGGSKVTRSLSDRFGFMNMSAAVSCKSSSAVAESVVYLPRHPEPHYLLHRRPTR